MTELLQVPQQLTLGEATRLVELEAVVDAGLQTFVEVGRALLEIRDGRLYRETYPTFEAYCRERWGMSRAHGYRLIDGARVAELVSPIGDIPNEAQARELVPLLDRPDELVETVLELRAEHGDRLTAGKLRQAVGQRLGASEAQSGDPLSWGKAIIPNAPVGTSLPVDGFGVSFEARQAGAYLEATGREELPGPSSPEFANQWTYGQPGGVKPSAPAAHYLATAQPGSPAPNTFNSLSNNQARAQAHQCLDCGSLNVAAVPKGTPRTLPVRRQAGRPA